MEHFINIYQNAVNMSIIKLVFVAIVMDFVFGILRSMKERKFNSCFGIDGAIRKFSMIISIMLLVLVDEICKFNMISFLPDQVQTYLPGSIGLSEFFAVLYIAYETVSVLKNMALCGLPVKGIWETVTTFLEKYTDELPDKDELKGER